MSEMTRYTQKLDYYDGTGTVVAMTKNDNGNYVKYSDAIKEIESLQKERANLIHDNKRLMEAVTESEGRLAEANTVIGFYANKEHYITSKGAGMVTVTKAISRDKGQIARAYQEKYNTIKQVNK